MMLGMAPTVLFLHGFTNTGASWGPVVAALGERYRALVPDLRGHGSAAAVRPVTLAHVIGDLAGLAPDRFALAGYSQGGRIALHAALALAPRVERLVLIGASPGLADPAERAARRAADEELAEAIEGETIEKFAERWAATPVLAGQSREVRAAAHADRLRSAPAGLAAALRGLGTGALPPLWERLPELAMPVTLIVGERDEKFRGVGGRMADLIPRAELVVVAGAGHAVHLEAPQRVAAEIIGGESDRSRALIDETRQR
ncbi:MAG TPA: 2-succinyl-6-hydroxy-2,4-cyclohexadiene-1-carboxylate synthase [Solirubrobacteraceae bacterium]|nr:2-succinyl-6-hydroxy-2,4-cyclohexadiene-1-carboxylate synthase [Solirubrobacteraceae bacterium]